jgi:hypothetical protein
VTPMSEAAFQQLVLEYARLHGYLAFHLTDARRPARRNGRLVWVGDENAKGYPDCTFVHPRSGDLFVAELKSRTGRVTPEQRTWLDAFRTAGVDAYVWKPADVPAIEARFKAGRKARAA